MRDAAARAWAHLSPHDRAWLSHLAELAAAQAPAARLALVGGAVRDALLGQTPYDLDIVVEGAEVEALARATGLPFTFHPAFQNATLTLPDGRGVDLVRARRETYPVWGANPVPQAGDLADDLRRRDFSLNALALVLGPEGKAALVDVTDGLADLEGRELRPLHAQSFAEDASRLIRGARLAARLDLNATPELLTQVPDAVAYAPQTPRLWAEVRLMLAEPRPSRVLEVLSDWGANELLPAAPLWGYLDGLQDAGDGTAPISPVVYAAALLERAPDRADLSERLGLGHKALALLERAESERPYPAGSPEQLLRGRLRPEHYQPLRGGDLLRLGFSAGPELGRALAHLAALRRAGRVGSRQDERQALSDYANAQNLTLAQPIE